MVKVALFPDGFVILGHASFAGAGEDIVCAGISAITQTTILALNKYCDITAHVEKGDISVHINTKCRCSDVLVDAMMMGLHMIEEQYPEHIKIKEVRN